MLSKQINIPSSINIQFQKNIMKFEGPKGSTTLTIVNYVDIKKKDNSIIEVSINNLKFKKFLNLFYNLINQKIEGIQFGFKKTLLLQGIGYKSEVQDDLLILKLGYSHPIIVSIPKGIQIRIYKNTKLNIFGNDLNKLTQFIFTLKKYRLPEPYKGKGIILKNEIIIKKEGKKK